MISGGGVRFVGACDESGRSLVGIRDDPVADCLVKSFR
jgi:hypothetical protein